MESTASILGAFGAQKLPTQKQTNAWIDVVIYQIDQVSHVSKDSGTGHLSEHGLRLANDLKQVLLAYKELGTHKNGDDQLQNAIYNLSQGQLTADPATAKTQSEALSDGQQASAAFQNVLQIFWRHLTSTSGGAGDLASFTRNFLADTAEVVEQHAGTVKSTLRETEAEVQEGKRDPLGRERTGEESGDLRERYERGMDTAKVTGSQAIGAGQAVKQSADEVGGKAADNLNDIFDAMLKRAENDPEYRDAVTTIFDLASKWFSKTIDAADNNSMDQFVNDPTGRIPAALSSFNTILERLASKSTRDLSNAFRTTAWDIRQDPQLRQYFDELHDFVRRTVNEPTYARSKEHDERRRQLRERWDQLRSGDDHRKWHDDIDHLQREIQDFFGRIERDQDVKRLREASVLFGQDFTQALATLNEAALGNANWLWQDIADVYMPRLIETMKGVPVPRTEYKDSEVEFVIEDLRVETLRLLPGHAHISNTTDMDISKTSVTENASTKVKSHTRIHFKGVQFKIKDVSFWYHDQTLTPISEVSGLMGITLPKEGLDVDVSLGLIPQPDKKEKESNQHAFFRVERVRVQLNNPTFDIRKSNHPILFTAFKPMVRNRLEKTIEASLAHQIAMSFEFLDGVAFDVHRRAGVFHDTGMSLSASYLSGIWSEIGHMKSQPGLFSGLRTTSVGIIKDDPRQDAAMAMGTQPQIISGEKHGPVAPGSNSHGKRDQANRLAEESKGRAQGDGERTKSGVVSFAEEVKIKKEQEQHREGWKSEAFNPPTVR